MMRKEEAFIVESKTSKLTITKDRVTIKISNELPKEKHQPLIKGFLKIADENPFPKFTLRSGGLDHNEHDIFTINLKQYSLNKILNADSL